MMGTLCKNKFKENWRWKHSILERARVCVSFLLIIKNNLSTNKKVYLLVLI